MRRWFSFVAFLIVVTKGYAQFGDSIAAPAENSFLLEEPSITTTQDPSFSTQRSDYRSESITVKKFDEKRWREVTGSHDYNDNRKRKSTELRSGQGRSGGADSGLRRNDREYDDEYDEDEDESANVNLGWLAPIFRILFYATAIAIIGVIIYQIVRNVSFRKNPKRTVRETQDPHDVNDISELDTESLLHQAHLAGDYKMAIRLYFLQLLKKLNENGTIVWAKDKTNRDYLSELFNKRYYFDEIRKLTFAYERVWYGEQLPTPELYDQISSEFRDMDQKLNSTVA